MTRTYAALVSASVAFLAGKVEAQNTGFFTNPPPASALSSRISSDLIVQDPQGTAEIAAKIALEVNVNNPAFAYILRKGLSNLDIVTEQFFRNAGRWRWSAQVPGSGYSMVNIKRTNLQNDR